MSKINKYKIGELRPSQIMHSFGIGAVIDFPNISGMVMGLEDWTRKGLEKIYEERLLRAVRDKIGYHIQHIFRPPVNEEDDPNSFEAKMTGIPVMAFPRWVRCPLCERMAEVTDPVVRFRPNSFRPDKMKYEHALCPKAKGFAPTMIPIRRLIACEQGHIDDFPWLRFVHGGKTDCKGPLYWREIGVTGSPVETRIECVAEGCGSQRNFLQAFSKKDREKFLDKCTGNHPHLRQPNNDCTGEPRPILLGASNSWFSMTMSVISIPAMEDELGDLVSEYWSSLQAALSVEVVGAFRNGGMLQAFDDYTDEEIFTAMEKHRAEEAGTTEAVNVRDLKAPEWEIFSRATDDFRHRNLDMKTVRVPVSFAGFFHRVRKVERLREAQALIGFTRLVAPGEFGEWDDDTPRVPLARTEVNWVPGNEIRGEGIFIEFNESRVLAWCNLAEIKAREDRFRTAHAEFRRRRGLEPDDALFPGMRFLLLHSFAHALMRQLALECGYSQAALRERIYSRNPGSEQGPMAGLLIYTSAPDSEGTLGGLSSLAVPDQMERHLRIMLESLRLCSSDPHCAEHLPEADGLTLHGAACHACLFSPETSCERGNKYLDRSLLVDSLAAEGLGFFDLDWS